MYNEELKTRFISECVDKETSKQRALRLFALSEPFEVGLNTDICAMLEDDLKSAIEATVSARLGTQTADMSILRKYARWCIENSVPGACNNLLQKQDVDYKKLREVMVSGPRQLQDYLDQAFPPESDCKQYNLCRCYFWMAFMGLDENAAAQITTENVDLKSLTVRFGGKEYPIYKESLPVLRHLCTANSFIYDFGRYETVIERHHGSKILRGTMGANEVNLDSIRRLAFKRVHATFSASEEKISLRYQSIMLSGVFYRMYKEELSVGEPNIKKHLAIHQKNLNAVSNDRRDRKEAEFSTDYIRWKAAFDK